MKDALDKLFNLGPDALVLVDCDGMIVKANEQADRLFHYPPGALVGQRVESLIPPEHRSRHEVHRTSYQTRPDVRPMGTGSQTLSGLRPDGGVFPVEIALSPLELEDATYYVASIRDVSESQLARQALMRARYDRLVASIGQQALLAPDAEVLLAGLPAQLCEALGVLACGVYTPESGDNLRLTGHHGLAESPLPQTIKVASLAPVFAKSLPVIVNAADSGAPLASLVGDAGFVSALAVPLVEHSRPLGAILVVAQDPGRFDQDELHCVQAIGNVVSAMLLRRRIEDQLAHSQRLEALGQLTGGIAHDFNNLLTVVSGNLQLMESNASVDAELRELIEDALRAVDHGASLTSKLLAFGRQQRLSPKRIDIGKLLTAMASMLRRTLGDAIKLSVTMQPGLPMVLADASQLDAALLNLALNSRDAMPRGGDLVICADAVPELPEAVGDTAVQGSYICISVRDTGAGMSPDVLARVFEPFFTTKDAGKGNGLGLSMAYGFARQSGGQLRARSQLGYGTTMELFLPAAESGELDALSAHGRAASSTVGHVLVVEDEEPVRAIATKFLVSLGWKVSAVGSAEEALQCLEQDHSISIVFSDISLGAGLSGTELAKRARSERPGLPVLLTTGFDRERGQDGNRESGFPLLSKPYRRQELGEALLALAKPA